MNNLFVKLYIHLSIPLDPPNHQLMLPSVSTPPLVKWTSNEGHEKIRSIIQEVIPQWTDSPRDYQVDSWARTLDSIDQLAIIYTSAGKTTLFYVPVLIMQYVNKNPEKKFALFPRTPVALVIVPLIELGNNHVSQAQSSWPTH